jgi:hypothetical protein
LVLERSAVVLLFLESLDSIDGIDDGTRWGGG